MKINQIHRQVPFRICQTLSHLETHVTHSFLQSCLYPMQFLNSNYLSSFIKVGEQIKQRLKPLILPYYTSYFKHSNFIVCEVDED